MSRSFAKGKVVVITGAASGIGAALAQEFAEDGAKLALSDLNAKGLNDLGQRLAAAGADLLSAEVDVARPDQVFAFAAQVRSRFAHADIVINNAGVALIAPALSGAMEDAHWLMNINFWGVVHGCRAFAPVMRKGPGSTIVNIASMFALLSINTQAIYCASKAAVRAYSDALREELRDEGIRVLCVLPGMVKTDLVTRARLGDISTVAPDHQSLCESFATAAVTTATQAAIEIVTAVGAGRSRLLIGRDSKLADMLSRITPARASRYASGEFRKQVGRTKRGMTRGD